MLDLRDGRISDQLLQGEDSAKALIIVNYIDVIDLIHVFSLFAHLVDTARLPWLLIGMIGGIGNSLILGNFEGNFAVNPKMALFIPLIGGTGGNVGIQSSAIVVQGLANNSLKEGNILPQILKESVVSLINASIISLVVFIYNFFMLGDRGITASVSLSLFAVVMFASVFGTLVPMTLDKLKIDPALATGPFITITNDIIGMMIYMFITSALAG